MSLKDDLNNLGVTIEGRLNAMAADTAAFTIAAGKVDAARLKCESEMMAATEYKPVPPPVSNLSLVLVDTSVTPPRDIQKLTAPTTVSHPHFNIRADYTGTKPGSVDCLINGKRVRVESSDPFYFFGDTNKVANKGTLTGGPLTISATPYTASAGGGTAGVPVVGMLTVEATPPPDTNPPPVTEQPSKSNTGPRIAVNPADGTFKPKSGGVYSGLIIKGTVELRGITRVTFRNCVIDASGSQYCIRCDDGETSAAERLIQNCELKNCKSAAIYGDGFTALYNYVHHSAGDGFKAKSNVIIQGNYVTMLGMSDGAHADGVQIRGHKNILIAGNFFDMPNNVAGTNSNAGIFLQLDGSANVTIDRNWFRGGNYCVCCYDVDAKDKISVTSNVFYSGSSKYGFGNIFDGVVWSGNKTDSGAEATTKMK